MSTILPYGPGPGEWDTIKELLQSAANYDFASGQKMTINGTVCGNVANASSIQGNGNYSNTGTVGGTEWVGPAGPIHSTYTSQPFDCQWFTVLPPACPAPSEPSDQLFVDIATASNTAKNLTPTQTFTDIDTNGGDVIINVVSGLNVINVPPNPFGTTEGKLQVRGNGDLIINGPSDAVVIFNVGADNEVNAVRNGMDITGGRSILITGGVQAQNILFNVLGGDLRINAGVVNGNILVRAGSDVKGKADIQGNSIINGVVIGDGNHSSEFSLAADAVICGGFPLIDIEKEVSNDNGTTWFDADNPTGPNVVNGTNPQFRFTVTNTGNVTLTNVQVTDDVLGLIAVIPSLAPGASQQFIVVGTWALGQQMNTATATGDYQGITVSDTDPAYWFGVQAPTASIDIVKEVSPNNGGTWFDADNPTGPNVIAPTNPQFRFTVTNTGNTTLTNVQVTDDVFGLIANIPSLAPGESQQFIIVGIWALGQQVNTATATGEFNGQTVSDTDPAYWVGVEASVPAIDVEKEVSPNNGGTWFDADNPPGPNVVNGTNPQFRFTVTNTGNVTLTNVQVTDDVFGLIATIPSLAPGASQQFIVVGTWALGQQVNTATATGNYQGATVSDTDPAYWFGVEAPTAAIDVEKEVSPDNGANWFDADNPPGPDVVNGTNPRFRFTVTNTGNVTLSNVVVSDNVFGVIANIPSLAPGASQQFIVVGAWAPGQQVNIATATGTFNGQTVTDTDPAYWVGVEEAVPAIDVIKEVSPDNGATWFDADIPTGPNVINPTNPEFRFTVNNTGNVTLTNVQVTDDVFGLIAVIPSLAAGASQQFIVVGTWASGQQVNTATATGEFNGQTVTDTDPAYWFGADPSINIVKEVSVDEGTTWIDANTPPGPTLPPGVTPQFRYTVTNTGNVVLTNITITDSVLGVIGTIPSLNPSQSSVFIVS